MRIERLIKLAHAHDLPAEDHRHRGVYTPAGLKRVDVNSSGQVDLGGGGQGTTHGWTRVADGGKISFHEYGRVWRDALGELLSKKTIGVRITDNATEGTVDFSDACRVADDWKLCNVQFNHDRDLSSIVSPHLHWFQASANVPNWMIAYRWHKNDGSAKVTSWTNAKYESHVFTYTSGTIHQLTEFPDITPPVGTSLSDIIQVRLHRDTNNASTLFAGSDPLVGDASALYFDIHIQINDVGSQQEYVK